MAEDDEPNSFSQPQPHLQENAANVGDLMAKAKKAAASLWLILHAQVSYHLVVPLVLLITTQVTTSV
jgi:ABC-type microcin C transport system permease subunit YejE